MGNFDVGGLAEFCAPQDFYLRGKKRGREWEEKRDKKNKREEEIRMGGKGGMGKREHEHILTQKKLH